MSAVYAFAVVCERILNEMDGIPSAIRIADLFRVKIMPGVNIEDSPVPIGLLVSLRLVENDELEHTTIVQLIRPDGEVTDIGQPVVGKIVQNSHDAPGGLNFAFQIGVVAKQWGLHKFRVIFDGNIVAETIFTLRQIEDVPISEPKIALEPEAMKN